MLLYVFKREETVERIVKCFFTKKKKTSTLPIPLLCKNHLLLAARSPTQISCLFPVARSCLTAL